MALGTLSYFLFILATLGLHCFAQAFSSCGKRGQLCCGAKVSYCSGFSCCKVQALGCVGSAVTAPRALEHTLISCDTGA